MSLVYAIMKKWIGDDVRVYFNEAEGAFTGKLAEVCDTGIFLVIEGEEYFVPFAQTQYVRRIKELPDERTV